MSEIHHDDDRTETHTALIKGARIGHYRIVEKIGAGGMGEVYLAEDIELNRRVALKFLPPHLCRDDDCRARFKREAQAAARLDHPNIIHIFEVSEHQGRPFFAMQHIEGRSLREYLADKELSIEQILELSLQICDGLQTAHEHGIIHRDIKPSNILIDAHGRARIVDFGLALVEGSDHLTKTGSTLGTIGYMSPEQVRGHDVDHRSDLFSLGVILYEMITRRNPFRRDTEAATLKAVSDDDYHPVARYRSGVPDDLQVVIDKALDKDVRLRYQTAGGMCADLKRVKRSLESASSVSPAAAPMMKSARTIWIAAAIIVLAAVVIFVTRPWSPGSGSDRADKIMLAVLPFENLGTGDDGYFADGITDEIISRLAALHGLGVISRTSSLQYRGTDKSLRQIGRELGVQYILEGTLLWDRSGNEQRVRINPQLIRVADDVHLWAGRYDAVINDIFEVQSSIAEEVVTALDLTLIDSERQALNRQPTDNVEAYDFYLRGMEYVGMPPDEKNILNAEAMFRHALNLEPDFILAMVCLSFVHGQMYLFGYDRSEKRLASAKEVVDRAIAIAPDDPEVHFALGWYYYQCVRDLDRARVEFSILRDKRPSDATLYMGLAAIDRVWGNWEASAQNWHKALELDPLSARVYFEYGTTLFWMRRYGEAEKAFSRAIQLQPDWRHAFTSKAQLYVLWKGDIEAARQVLREALQYNERWPDLTIAEIELDILAREYDRALERLPEPQAIAGYSTDDAYYYNLKGDIYRHLGRVDLMTTCYDSARVIKEKLVGENPDDPYQHAELSWAYAGLGRGQEAIREGQMAVEKLPLSQHAFLSLEMVKYLADTYVLVGEYDLAVEQFEILLSHPCEITVTFIKMWPDYEPLLNLPKFQELLKQYEAGS